MELCPVFNSPASTFYIRVHSYKAHQSGNLNINGTNLLQVFVTGSGGKTTAASTTLGTSQFIFTLFTKVIQIKAKHLVLKINFIKWQSVSKITLPPLFHLPTQKWPICYMLNAYYREV